MFIDEKNRVLFIHVPKCAGRTIRKGYLSEKRENTIDIKSGDDPVSEEVPMHISARTLKALTVKVDEYHTFAIVRNPWNWLVSLYLYTLIMPELWQRGVKVPFPRGIKQSDGREIDIERCWRTLMFSEFKHRNHVGGFTKWLAHCMQWVWNPFPVGPGLPAPLVEQTEWFRDARGAHIFKLEDMHDQIPEFLKRRGASFEWPEINVYEYEPYDYHDYYNERTRDWVGQIHKQTIDVFGYEF